MYAATWNKEEKTSEIGMIEMSDTVVYPRTVMIHLHDTSSMHAHRGINASISTFSTNSQVINLRKLQFIKMIMAVSEGTEILVTNR